MVAGTVRYSTMIPVPVATLYPLKYRRRYFWELELDPGAGAVDTAKHIRHRSVQPQQLVGGHGYLLSGAWLPVNPELPIDPSFWKQRISSGWPSC